MDSPGINDLPPWFAELKRQQADIDRHERSRMMGAVLAHLRREATRDVPSRLGPLCGQAADEVERLLAEVADLKAQLRELGEERLRADD